MLGVYCLIAAWGSDLTIRADSVTCSGNLVVWARDNIANRMNKRKFVLLSRNNLFELFSQDTNMVVAAWSTKGQFVRCRWKVFGEWNLVELHGCPNSMDVLADFTSGLYQGKGGSGPRLRLDSWAGLGRTQCKLFFHGSEYHLLLNRQRYGNNADLVSSTVWSKTGSPVFSIHFEALHGRMPKWDSSIWISKADVSEGYFESINRERIYAPTSEGKAGMDLLIFK